MLYGHGLVAARRILCSCRRCARSAVDYSKNYYELLEVKRDATQQEIKNAFYMLSKKYHPDVTGSAPGSALTERFIAIKEAYDVLKDAGSRRDYDMHRAQTSSDYAHRAYQSQRYGSQNTGYGTWRSNRYAGSSSDGQYRSTWPYSEAHLKRVFEEIRRRAEEYERERDEQYWERFFRAESQRYKKRRQQEMPPRPSVKLAIDSWLSGPLLPYLPYLSAALIVYMIGFFFYSLYSVVSDRKVPIGVIDEEERESVKFNDVIARERLAHDMQPNRSHLGDVVGRQISDMIREPPAAP